MNNTLYSRQRKSKILDTIIEGKVFTRFQIQQLFLSNHKDGGKRKAQEILSSMVKDEMIKRYYKDHALPSIYYADKKPLNLKHPILINDIYCCLFTQKKKWMHIDFQWSYSIYNEMVVTDLYANIYWEPDKKKRQVVWIEAERDVRKRFNKDDQFEKVFLKDWHKPPFPEWVVVDEESKVTKFPTILIVTDYPPEINSKSNLHFVVASLEDCQKDIYSLIKRK